MSNVISGYLSQILLILLLAFAAWLGTQAKNLYKKYVTTEIKQAVCRTVVRTVEQIYKDLHGEEKLHKAMGRASRSARSATVFPAPSGLRYPTMLDFPYRSV